MRRALLLLGAAVTFAALSGAAEPSPSGLSFSGTYVLLEQTVTVSELPVLADVEATTLAVSIQELRQEGDRLQGTGRLCGLDIVSTAPRIPTLMIDTNTPTQLRSPRAQLSCAGQERPAFALVARHKSPTASQIDPAAPLLRTSSLNRAAPVSAVAKPSRYQ